MKIMARLAFSKKREIIGKCHFGRNTTEVEK
jgi:hypothetical protein